MYFFANKMQVGSKDGDVRVLRAELLSAQNKIKENTGEVRLSDDVEIN